MRFRLKLILVVVFVLESSAYAFTLLQSSQGSADARWRQFPIRFYVNYANAPFSQETINDVIHEALGLWNSVPDSALRAEFAGQTDVSAPDLIQGLSPVNAIVFDKNFHTTMPGRSASVLAVGTAISQDDEFTHAMIIVNAESALDQLSSERLKVVLAHEVGHTFGLGHTQDTTALMYPTVREIGRLGEDDARGISFLYPRKEGLDGTGIFGCGSIRNTNSSERFSLDFTFWVSVFLLSWMILRGYRRLSCR